MTVILLSQQNRAQEIILLLIFVEKILKNK